MVSDCKLPSTFYFLRSVNRSIWLHINAILGSLTVTVGLWLLLGELSLTTAVILSLTLAILLSWWSVTIAHVWAVSTLLLGLESLAWPIQQMIDMRTLGPEPPLEDLQRIFTAVLFGLFSGVFWMTFSYGIYRRIRSKAESLTSQGGKSLVNKGHKSQRRKQK